MEIVRETCSVGASEPGQQPRGTESRRGFRVNSVSQSRGGDSERPGESGAGGRSSSGALGADEAEGERSEDGVALHPRARGHCPLGMQSQGPGSRGGHPVFAAGLAQTRTTASPSVTETSRQTMTVFAPHFPAEKTSPFPDGVQRGLGCPEEAPRGTHRPGRLPRASE